MPRRLPLILLAAVVSLPSPPAATSRRTVTQRRHRGPVRRRSGTCSTRSRSRGSSTRRRPVTPPTRRHPGADRGLDPDQIWFGVWMRVSERERSGPAQRPRTSRSSTRAASRTSRSSSRRSTPSRTAPTAVAANGQYPLKGSCPRPAEHRRPRAVQAPGRRARLPPARARDPGAGAAHPSRSSSTSETAAAAAAATTSARLSIETSIPRAAGAALSPPARGADEHHRRPAMRAACGPAAGA